MTCVWNDFRNTRRDTGGMDDHIAPTPGSNKKKARSGLQINAYPGNWGPLRAVRAASRLAVYANGVRERFSFSNHPDVVATTSAGTICATRPPRPRRKCKTVAQEKLGHVRQEVPEKWGVFEDGFRNASSLAPLNASENITLNAQLGPRTDWGERRPVYLRNTVQLRANRFCRVTGKKGQLSDQQIQ